MLTLMLRDEEVACFDLDEFWIEVKRPELMPFALRDWVRTTEVHMSPKQVMQGIDALRDWLAARVLSLSRLNAKVILNVATLPQSMKISERLKICFACKGLTMSDSYWLREGEESFCQVNLRGNSLCDASYSIAILGKYVPIDQKELRSDLSTLGMFPKFWKKNGFLAEMWKTDKTIGCSNTTAELKVSEILKKSNVKHTHYRREEMDGRVFAVSDCIANEDFGMVNASEVRDWCSHRGLKFLPWILEKFGEDFRKMCLVDYVVANTDRHLDNWGFVMNNHTGELVEMLPLFDHNQALLADEFGTEIEELIYEPTGMSFQETIQRFRGAELVIEGDLPLKAKERYNKIM